MTPRTELSRLGRRLADLRVEAQSPDGTVRALARGDQVEVTVVGDDDADLDDDGATALESALATVCSELLAARRAARSGAIEEALIPDPRPRSARELQTERRLAEITVEGRSAPDDVVVRVLGGHRVAVDLGDLADPVAVGPAVGEAMTAALVEHRVASYRVRCELWGTSREDQDGQPSGLSTSRPPR